MDVSGWNKELSAIETLLELSLRDTLEAEFAGAILIRLQGMLYIQCKLLDSDTTHDTFYLCIHDNPSNTTR